MYTAEKGSFQQRTSAERKKGGERTDQRETADRSQNGSSDACDRCEKGLRSLFDLASCVLHASSVFKSERERDAEK